jgi:DNA-binding XRE family transcriptional regulator
MMLTIYEIRLELRTTQTELAQLLGKSKSTIQL